MSRSARRFGLLTLVVFTCSLVAVQAQEALPQDSAALTQAFLEAALADQQADEAISTAVAAASPDALATSAARMSTEAARAKFWLPPASASRTITVRHGQSLWDIAVAWGITVETIAAANNLTDVNMVKPGQRLTVPVGDDPSARAKVAANAAKSVAASAQPTAAKPPAVRPTAAKPATVRTAARPSSRPAARAHTVRLSDGQTLWSLARAHGTSVDAIVAANGLSNANRVRAGTRLVIPGRTAASRPSRVSTARAGGQRASEAFTKASTGAVRIARGFLWPARGQLTSRFGWRRWRHHDGVDIAVPYGSPIYAARPGRVAFSGWYYAYGRTVIIDHGDGVQTLYAHASALLVSAGETVRQGQLIARVGTSGRSTGPHLHFEVRRGGQPVNPMRYMN